MTNEQLIILLKSRIDLLKVALEKSDYDLGDSALRDENYNYIGENDYWFAGCLNQQQHRQQNPDDWEKETGEVIALEPIRDAIDDIEQLIETLRSE